MMKKIVSITAVTGLILLFASCSPKKENVLRIAVAANMSSVTPEIVEAFEKSHPGTNVEVSYGSSGQLSAQILNEAPFDLFLAANMAYPEKLYSQGYAVHEPVVYAQGIIALFTVKDYDLSGGLDILKSPKVKQISLPKPELAPYGKAAVLAIERSNLSDMVEGKIIYSETISKALEQAIAAADFGFISKSALYAPEMQKYKEGVHWITVDSSLYEPINQGMVILKNGKDKKEVKELYDFLLSEEIKKTLHDYGYQTP